MIASQVRATSVNKYCLVYVEVVVVVLFFIHFICSSRVESYITKEVYRFVKDRFCEVYSHATPGLIRFYRVIVNFICLVLEGQEFYFIQMLTFSKSLSYLIRIFQADV